MRIVSNGDRFGFFTFIVLLLFNHNFDNLSMIAYPVSLIFFSAISQHRVWNTYLSAFLLLTSEVGGIARINQMDFIEMMASSNKNKIRCKRMQIS